MPEEPISSVLYLSTVFTLSLAEKSQTTLTWRQSLKTHSRDYAMKPWPCEYPVHSSQHLNFIWGCCHGNPPPDRKVSEFGRMLPSNVYALYREGFHRLECCLYLSTDHKQDKIKRTACSLMIGVGAFVPDLLSKLHHLLATATANHKQSNTYISHWASQHQRPFMETECGSDVVCGLCGTASYIPNLQHRGSQPVRCNSFGSQVTLPQGLHIRYLHYNSYQ